MNKDYEKLLNHELFYTTKEVIDLFGPQYELRLRNALVIRDYSLFERYKKENLVSIISEGKRVSVSEDLLVDLINNPAMFGYLFFNLDNPVGISVQIYYFDNKGNIVDNILITKAEISKLLNKVDKSKFKTHTFLPLIESKTSEETLIKTYENGEKTFYIDGQNIKCRYIDLINLLLMTDEEFRFFIKNSNKSKEYMYMLINFFEKERILSKYNLNENAVKRYLAIKNNEYVDVEAINYDRKMEDPDNYDNQLVNQIFIDEELFNKVTEDIDKRYSKVEIAIHIYLKLCELVTLDQNYYASSRTVEDLLKHSDVSQINNINLTDNELVCYEFTLLYAAILKQFGITYKIIRKEDSYTSHTYLNIRANEFIFNADSVTSVNETDITNVKLNSIINGLESINKNETTKKLFKEKVNLIYKNILNKKRIKAKFYSALNQYINSKELKTLPFTDKVLMIIKGILRSDLKGIDNINYLRQMFNIAFSNNDNVSYTFLSSTINNYKKFDYTVITLLSIRDEIGNYKYFVIDSNNNSVEEISVTILYDRMVNKDYAYINASSNEIPGLGLGSVTKYVR